MKENTTLFDVCEIIEPFVLVIFPIDFVDETKDRMGSGKKKGFKEINALGRVEN